MIDRSKFQATSIYIILQEIIDSELNDIETYANESSSDLLTKQKKLEDDFDAAISASDDNEEVHSYYENDLHKYFKALPLYTFNPTLLILYGLFENWLKKLCIYHHKRKFSKIKVSDLAGSNDIERSRRYLKIVAEINLESVEKEWQKIITIQKIRNAVAHNNASVITNKDLPIEKQDLYKLIEPDNRFYFDKKLGDFYIKDKEFILEVIALFRTVLSTLISELSKRKVHARNTTMPNDNTEWGQEKIECLLKDVIHGLKLIESNEKRTDEFKDNDLKYNLKGHFGSMAWNLTKLYSFFCDGNWTVNDSILISEKREEGLEELQRRYKSD